ncbi:erv26 super [Pseudogymnoascus destructans]|uniref:Erv26 super protein n=2 Tax=Pseudogymnoascus destructans TaxID=655981 RepID=L8G0I2_PSED2|nr:erv26 super [Pseudogymnoascus destructans]ELR06228.1 hypothetical protein GMDG_02023 [Pseudogymnoascus destructans 20631-21]OAF58606.1 erv26 super [Pseudogymnoascus destructans]
MAHFWILPLVGYLGMALGFGFLTLAIASGLYYLSELVEEHTVIAKRLLTRIIYAVIAIQTLLVLVDGFPKFLSLIGIVSHVVYLGNMRRFPVVKLSDPLFLSSCVLVLINHYYCFAHFSSLPRAPTHSIYDAPTVPTFTEIASYFGICVWLVPFALFVSLSASDNVLPTMGSEAPSGSVGPGDRQKRQGLVKVVVDGFIEWVGNAGNVLGWWKTDRRSSIL